MHTDQGKRFDKRNIEANLRRKVMTPKEHESYLSKLPDMSHKIYDPEEELLENEPESASGGDYDRSPKKKGAKVKGKN